MCGDYGLGGAGSGKLTVGVGDKKSAVANVDVMIGLVETPGESVVVRQQL